MAVETKTPVKPVTPPVNGSPAKAKRVRKNPAPENETREQKFKRLAHMRVPKAAKAILALGNLCNINSYEYTPEQAAGMIDYVQKKLDYVKQRFIGKKEPADEFRLS